MSMTKAEAGRLGGHARAATMTAEQHRAHMQKARPELAVRKVVESWPELTDEQQQRLRALLRPVPEGGGRHGQT